MSDYECSCAPRTVSTSPFCSQCGGRAESAVPNDPPPHGDVTANDGVAAGGSISVGGDLTIGRHFDNIVETEIVRTRVRRPFFADSWVTTLSAVCTVLAFALTRFDPVSRLPIVVLTMLALCILFLAIFGVSVWFRFLMPADVPIPSRIAPGILWERTPGRGIEASSAYAICPRCARGLRSSTMTVIRMPNDAAEAPGAFMWVCRKYSNHRLLFDGALIPEVQ
ncbi:hypothetical protein SAMN05421642_107135 [Rhodococcoides kyotonense]|uniref:Uncharacterized protein n=1 Tax=Rhodococcoides kyotonense TaxID=398843 RepID=A0A239IMY4_9NOCA|nr:hypothetical protein SAMN05421642_107135 [Rhodococcus kyotonensis]